RRDDELVGGGTPANGDARTSPDGRQTDEAKEAAGLVVMAKWRAQVRMEDVELVRQLEARDRPLPAHRRRHLENGVCRYQAFYSETACPWCEAELRRLPPEPVRRVA